MNPEEIATYMLMGRNLIEDIGKIFEEKEVPMAMVLSISMAFAAKAADEVLNEEQMLALAEKFKNDWYEDQKNAK